MKNVKFVRKGDVLTIEVDLSQDFGRSKSGKSIVISTTEGNEALGDGVFVGVNVYRKA